MMLLTLRGTPFLYYGDEIGMPNVPVPFDQLRDPVGLRGWPEDLGRDGSRTPMQWSSGPGAGFTTRAAEPWLPIGDAERRNVGDQRSDPGSTLNLCRDLIALRRSEPDLHAGRYATLDSPRGVWAWRRGERFRVALNLSDRETRLAGREGRVAIGTRRDRDGEEVGRQLTLRPWEGVLIEVS
jgi:alpha-glucosidase